MKRLMRIFVALLPFLLVSTVSSAETFIRMVSGPSGGSWYPLGAKIMEVLGNEISGIATSNGPGGGVGNVKDVNRGEAEIGWTYSHTAFNGFSGKGSFDKPHKNVRHFATLYLSAFQTAVVKSSSIQSYADLSDKRINPGPKHFSGFAAAKLVFGAYDLTFDGIAKNGGTVHSVSYTDAAALMKDGHLDAFIALTSVPQATIIDINFKPGIRLLGIEPDVMKKFLKVHPEYFATTIPTTAYDGMAKEVTTLGTVASLVINKDVPDDIVYQMTKVFWANHAVIAKVKPKTWARVKLEDALVGAGIPIHPGAKRFYDEAGVKKK